MKSIRWTCLLVFAFLACSTAQRAEPPAKSTEPRYETRKEHDPNGIGKFYMGREMAMAMTKALKLGGRMVFVEFRMEDEKVPIKLVHKMSEKQVLKEMEPHPLKHVKTLDVLPWQHIIIFEKKDDAGKKSP